MNQAKSLSLTIDDSPLGEVVGRQLDPNLIARDNANEVLSHSPGNMCHHLRTGFELDPKSGVGERLCHSAFDLEGFFFISQNPTSNQGMLSLVTPTASPTHRYCRSSRYRMIDPRETVARINRPSQPNRQLEPKCATHRAFLAPAACPQTVEIGELTRFGHLPCVIPSFNRQRNPPDWARSDLNSQRSRRLFPQPALVRVFATTASDYRLLNWTPRRAPLKPGFLRSFIRESRVR